MKTHTLYTLIIVALVVLFMHECNRSDFTRDQFKQEQKKLQQHLGNLVTDYIILETKTDSLQRLAGIQKQKVDSIRNAPPRIVVRWKEREYEIADLSPSQAFEQKDSISTGLGLRTYHTDSLMTALEAKHFVWMHEKIEVQDSVISWQGLTISELDRELELQYEIVGQYQGQVGNLLEQGVVRSLQVAGLEQELKRTNRQRRANKWLYGGGGLVVGVLVGVLVN